MTHTTQNHNKSTSFASLPWENMIEEKTIPIDKDFLLNKTVQGISAGARWLYICMAMECAGHREFIFPLSSAKKYGIAEQSFRRYVDELINHKFIKRHSNANLRKPNQYEFIFNWMEVADDEV